MSVAILNACRPFRASPAAKSVLIAMADYADDSGRCWPSLAKLCSFTCLCERAVRNAIRDLEKSGVIACERASGLTTQYLINVVIARATPASGAAVETPEPQHEMPEYPGTTCPRHDVPPRHEMPPTPAPDAADPGTSCRTPRHLVPPNYQELPDNNQRTTKPPAAEVVELPDWLPRIEWRAYVEMRVRMKKPLTPHAVKLAIGKLDEFRMAGDDPKAVLNNSVMGSWQGLFPLRKQNAGPSRLATPAAGTDYGRL